jgi:hypothetical protein
VDIYIYCGLLASYYTHISFDTGVLKPVDFFSFFAGSVLNFNNMFRVCWTF